MPDVRKAFQGRALIVDRAFYECNLARGVPQPATCTWDAFSALQEKLEANVVVAMGLPQEDTAVSTLAHLKGWKAVDTRTHAAGYAILLDSKCWHIDHHKVFATSTVQDRSALILQLRRVDSHHAALTERSTQACLMQTHVFKW